MFPFGVFLKWQASVASKHDKTNAREKIPFRIFCDNCVSGYKFKRMVYKSHYT